MRWIRANLLAKIESWVERAGAGRLSVSLILDEKPIEQEMVVPDPVPVAAAERAPREEHRLNPGFTFGNFVNGKANQIARAAAIQVAENPGTAYNPLFIYGGTGLGKTHLLQAIGTEVLKRNPKAKVRYIHAEQFVAILLKKAENDGVRLDENVAFFIAKHIRSNVRELEGALKRVLAYARFNNAMVTVGTAREALKDLLAVLNRQVSIENIQKTVADYFKIKVSEMYSKKRFRSVARPRQVAMALAKDLTQQSLPEIGEAFGGRDHTTVLHACRKTAELRESDQKFARDYAQLQQILLG